MKIIGMIPARLGSQRLPRKNLRTIAGVPLVRYAMRRCKTAKGLSEIWVNSESEEIGRLATLEGVRFHRRPDVLATNDATSEEFVHEFLLAHACDWLVQVHSISPLLTPEQITAFAGFVAASDADVVLSVVPERIECLFEGKPVNFSLERKENSQDLSPVHRVTWSITGWRRSTYLEARSAGRCATYAGRIALFPVDRAAGHIIKTEEDLRFAQTLLEASRELR